MKDTEILRHAMALFVIVALTALGGCQTGGGINTSATTGGAAGVYGGAPILGPAANNIITDAVEFVDQPMMTTVDGVHLSATEIADQIVNLPYHGPMKPIDRQALTRLQLGLPEPAALRIERRRAAVRAAMGLRPLGANRR